MIAEFPFVAGPIPKEGGSRDVVPDVRYEDPMVLEVSHDIAWAIDHSTPWEEAPSSVGGTREIAAILEFSIRAVYEDLEHNKWDTSATLVVDRVARTVSIRH